MFVYASACKQIHNDNLYLFSHFHFKFSVLCFWKKMPTHWTPSLPLNTTLTDDSAISGSVQYGIWSWQIHDLVTISITKSVISWQSIHADLLFWPAFDNSNIRVGLEIRNKTYDKIITLWFPMAFVQYMIHSMVYNYSYIQRISPTFTCTVLQYGYRYSALKKKQNQTECYTWEIKDSEH